MCHSELARNLKAKKFGGMEKVRHSCTDSEHLSFSLLTHNLGNHAYDFDICVTFSNSVVGKLKFQMKPNKPKTKSGLEVLKTFLDLVKLILEIVSKWKDIDS